MALTLKPSKTSNPALKKEIISSVQQIDKTKISVDIDTNLYLKILELKVKIKKHKKVNMKIKEVVNEALILYFQSLNN